MFGKTTKQPEILRQGDILLIERPDLKREQLTHCDTGKLVLAYGEVTGHAHRLEDDGSFYSEMVITKPELEVFANIGEMKIPGRSPQPKLYLVVDNTTNLTHEEHAPIEIKADKIYEVRRQREFDMTEGYRRVQD